MSQCPYANLLDPQLFAEGYHHEKLGEVRRSSGGVAKIDDPITGVPYWAILTRETCDYVSKNPEIFSSQARTAIPHEFDQDQVDFIMSQMLVNMDAPGHMLHRRITRNAFTVKAVDSYEPRFRKYAKQIVDAVAASGECEFVRDVAAELPLIAILELCGVPLEDRNKFFEWTNAMIFRDEANPEEAEEAANLASAEVLGYAARLAEQHRENPDSIILTALLDGEVDGERLSAEEFQWFFLMLIVAGNESTRTVTTHMMRLLMENPEQLQMLVDNPDMIDGAIEEALRYNTAFMVMRRTAMQDVELGGQQICKGDKVVMFYHSINFDEDVFEDPMTFDVTRAQRMPNLYREHRAFGVGQHFCLGSHLARLELKVMMEEIIPRIRNPQLAGPVKYMKDLFVNGIASMPITFDPEPQTGLLQ